MDHTSPSNLWETYGTRQEDASKMLTPPTVVHKEDNASDVSDPLDHALAQLEADHQILEYSPSESELLGPFSVACLFLNRTIGSGIYASPAFVLEGTRSLGISLILWVLGAIVALCSLLVWLEFGLSIPLQRDPVSNELKSTPRSGGEKNFLEYVFKRPKLLATCTYGIMFLVLGNLAGNAVYIGQYTMLAARGRYPQVDGLGPADAGVIGIAICALTLSVLMHVFSRRGGIIINNIFAVVKVCLLVVVIIVGFMNYGYAKAGKDGPDGWHAEPNITMINMNFDPSESMKTQGDAELAELAGDGSSIIGASLYVIYGYSGYYQVFYVLSEVATPRKTVPKASFFALGLVTVLYILVNISYFFVLSATDFITDNDEPPANDLAGRFFTAILGPDIGRKVMCSLLVISVFGNLLTMSFVAGRVKQEIAKEGILPFSRFFAKANQTPWSWLMSKVRRTTSRARETERAPITGLFLHWVSTMVCIIATAWIHPSLAYSIWVTLYGFSIRLLIPIFVSGSLIYLKLRKSCGWREVCSYNCGLIPAIVTFSVLMTVFWAGFAKPAVRFTTVNPYYILPLIALTSLFWGMLWWAGLRLLEALRKEEMAATRTTIIEERPGGEFVQVAEVVDIEWRARFRHDLESVHP